MTQKTLKLMILVVLAGFLITIIPVAAMKSAEQSIGDTLTRGSRFTVTITGVPNSSYYIWIPHTSSMTGEPRDQPPVIMDSQAYVSEDPEDGPWPIGSYQYNNGNGQTIRDDIPPSTPAMPNTKYYALARTDSRGQVTVEFQTSINTGLRSYSIRVENPKSVDSDNLMVELQVYSRKAPSAVGIYTLREETPDTTSTPVTTVLPVTTITTAPVTTTTEPVTTILPPPAQTTTRKAPAALWTGILAAGLGLILVKRQ